MYRYEFPIDKSTLADEIGAVVERIDNRFADKPIDPEKLNEEDRQLYDDFNGLLSLVDDELKELDLDEEYSPHRAAQSVADALEIPTYIARGGTCLRVVLGKSMLVDYEIVSS